MFLLTAAASLSSPCEWIIVGPLQAVVLQRDTPEEERASSVEGRGHSCQSRKEGVVLLQSETSEEERAVESWLSRGKSS